MPACSPSVRNFSKNLTMPFYGYNRPGAKVSEGVRNSFWLQGMTCGFPASYFCIKGLFPKPISLEISKSSMCRHGSCYRDDDQIVPISASAMLASRLVKDSTLKVYPGFYDGMCPTHKDQINADLLALIKN
jgi:non-heme chloroperoxidase